MAFADFSPEAQSVIRLFSYNFRAAPTADLIELFANEQAAGRTVAQQLDMLYDYSVPDTPFGAYASSSSDEDFVAALVDNYTSGTEISDETKAGWVDLLLGMADDYPTHGGLAEWVMNAVDTYTGDHADLIQLREALHVRVEAAADFAESAAGETYEGGGWGQLLEPLAPEPSYQLTANSFTVNEGANITFTLQTTDVAPGTSIGYTFGGAGITADDVAGGALTGTMVVNAIGVATATITLAADAATEGVEMLRMTLGDELDQAVVSVNDTSTAVARATYDLSSNLATVNEGGTVFYTLTTTNLPEGSVVAFTLSGAGIAGADIAGGQLTGSFLIDSQGLGHAAVELRSDATTEGTETLRLRLTGNLDTLDVTVNDTSPTPVPSGEPDTVVIADAMSNSNAHAPATPAEGEVSINTYLNYDLLDQGGLHAERMTIAELKATSPTAGAPLDATNQSADRGNIPQLSNRGLFTFDLGLETDRVDYSAESGKIVAVITTEGSGTTQNVLVNDNATDDVFNGATDRMDVLRNVEEVVASQGGGVLDLTNSGRDWLIQFSRNFNAGTDVVTASDRAVHRVRLADLDTDEASVRSFFEFRDAGQSASVTQATAAWTVVQGSDRDETIEFTSYQATEDRSNMLRGGTNSVKFNDLTRSVLVDVAITPWAGSTSLADDTNTSGHLVATTRFTNGDGATLLSAATNVTSSHTPDNDIAAGMLKLAASQDAEDAIGFDATDVGKVITLGATVSNSDAAFVRLVGTSTPDALQLTGFELLNDNGASDDLYVIAELSKAIDGSPRLVDAAGDHDTVRLGTDALGDDAVGGNDDTIELATLNGAADGFDADFDVLDLSELDASGLTVIGTGAMDDELVLAELAAIDAVGAFESLVLTNASTDQGALTLDLDAGAVKAGATTLFTYTGATISGGGLLFGTAGQMSAVPAMTSALSVTVLDNSPGAGATLRGGSAADTLTGGAGDDTLRGGAGNDALNGGAPPSGSNFSETWDFTIAGTPDAVTAAANRITITMTIDGTALTLTEAAVADTAYGDGNGAVVDGASTAAIGSAMAGLINANLAAINAGAGSGTLAGASFNSGSGVVRLTFEGGVDADDAVVFVLNSGAGPDGGNLTLSAGVSTQGGNGGSDTFVFEKTGAANGADVIQGFTAGSDKLDVTAFTGAAITAAGASIDADVGGAFAGVATTAEFIFDKAGATLAASDFATVPAAGKLALADGAKCVVAVTPDETGARGDAANTAVSLYYVENGPAAGLGDLTVSLVGVISGPAELTLAEIFTALT